MTNPSDTERLALAHKQARDIMKRCDDLIDRAERELSKFTTMPNMSRPRAADCKERGPGRFRFASLTAPPSVHGPVANSN